MSMLPGILVIDPLRRPYILVEHMEEEPTRWLLAEYVEAYEEARRRGVPLAVSGVEDPRLAALLSRRGIPWTRLHSWELPCPGPAIVLDLWAEETLKPWEARAAGCHVIGGIMGDHPPRGRGRLLSLRHTGAISRNLGRAQLSIHTAVWAVLEVMGGAKVSSLPLAGPGKVSIRTPLGSVEVELPYAYPARRGRPVVPERIRRVLERGVFWDEL